MTEVMAMIAVPAVAWAMYLLILIGTSHLCEYFTER